MLNHLRPFGKKEGPVWKSWWTCWIVMIGAKLWQGEIITNIHYDREKWGQNQITMTGIILNGGGGARRTRRKRQDSRQNKNSAEECEYSFANHCRLLDIAVKTKKKMLKNILRFCQPLRNFSSSSSQADPSFNGSHGSPSRPKPYPKPSVVSVARGFDTWDPRMPVWE